VDGQQRLTTLIILLKAVSKYLRDADQSEAEEKREINKMLVKGDNRIILLQANHDSATILRNYLDNYEIPQEHSITNHARRNVYNAIIECEIFVQEWIVNSCILDLLKIIKNRLGFVFYEIADKGSVYTVFEVLNSRGLSVDDLDKCKSMLMGIAYEKMPANVFQDIEPELHQKWTEIYGLVGSLEIPGHEILRFTATLFGIEEKSRLVSSENAIQYFRDMCSADPAQVVTVSEWLRKVTEQLKILYEDNKWMVVNDISHARLLAVSIALRVDLSIQNRKRLLKQWENSTFRIFGLCNKDSRHKVGEYTRLAYNINTNIDGYQNVNEILQMLQILASEPEFQIINAVEKLRRANCYDGWESDAKYFLYKYEIYLANTSQEHLNSDIWNRIWMSTPSETLEHIFPQNPDATWTIPQNLKDHVHRIGNLIVLPKGLNSRARNYNFSRKKEVYRNNYLRIMKDVLTKVDLNGVEQERNEWRIENIEERENILLDWAITEWADIN
jgi:hypothetical protein